MNPFYYAFPAAATLAQLLPLFAVVPRWRQAPEVRRWVAAWCLVFFLSDVLQLAVSRLRYTNLWLFMFINPIEDGLILWILSYWQVTPVARLAMRMAIPLVIVTYLVIAIATGEHRTYQAFAGPFRALVVLSATLFTLISRIAARPEGAPNRDWFWVTLGVALYYGLHVATEPIVSALGTTDRMVMIRIFSVKAIFDVVAFILIWRGMRCPVQNGYSGST